MGVDCAVVGKIKVLKYEQESIEIDRQPVIPQDECKRVHKAKKRAICELRSAFDKRIDTLSEVELNIFQTQLFLLEDDELENDILNAIYDESLAAETAVSFVAKKYEYLFEDISDPALKSRLDDIQGVCHCIIDNLDKKYKHTDQRLILVGKTISPFAFMQYYDSMIGCVCEHGTTLSHVGILCSARNIPFLSGIPISSEWDNQIGIIDDIAENFIVGEKVFSGHIVNKKIINNDDFENGNNIKTKVSVAINETCDLINLDKLHADGIGLVRTEYLFMRKNYVLTIHEQTCLYRQISEALPNENINIRLLDICKEKSVPGIECDWNSLPSSYRSVRVLLSKPQLLYNQIKAILLANEIGNLRILIPFIVSTQEIHEIKKIIREVSNTIDVQGQNQKMISIGVMIETPAAAAVIERILEEVDFIAIGTNDLLHTLYVTDRLETSSEKYIDSDYAAFWNVIRYISEEAHKNKKQVSVCGDFATNEQMIKKLIQLKIDELCVPTSALIRVRQAVATAEAAW